MFSVYQGHIYEWVPVLRIYWKYSPETYNIKIKLHLKKKLLIMSI